MPNITRQEVERVARLARLQLPAEELHRVAEQLSSILEYVGKLQQVATDDVPVTAQVTGLRNVARPDVVAGCAAQTREGLLAAAPDREGDLIRTTGVFADQ